MMAIAAMPERIDATCRPDRVAVFIAAPPVENNAAAATTRRTAAAGLRLFIASAVDFCRVTRCACVRLTFPSSPRGFRSGHHFIFFRALMPLRRYTILVADRTSGVVRRATVAARLMVLGACGLLITPILVGFGAAWKGQSDVAQLRESHAALEIENANYREATRALAGQIESLQTAISDLSSRSELDPNLAKAMSRLPALVKSRAMGGNITDPRKDQDLSYARTLSALAVPEDTFGLLRTLLEGLQDRLNALSRNVERRNALANATPSMWPAYGWLSSGMGLRRDPVTGDADYHNGLDI